MNKVLLWLGILFTALGIVFVAAGGTLALLVAPLLGLVALPGGIFLVLGLAFLGTIARIRRDRTWLQENGRIIEADILGVQYDTRVRVNGRCPLVLQCQAVNPADDLDQQDLPDIVSQRLTDLDRRLSQLEKAAQGDIPPTAAQIAARQRK